MTRLWATLQQDIVLQYRNGFYLATAVVVAVWLGLWQLIPAGTSLNAALLIPAIVILNLVFTGFYFMAAQVLLEKSQGVIVGLMVTPLRRNEYLLGKIFSLALLTILESGVLVLVLAGWHFQLLWLLIGVLYSCGFYALIAYITVSRYQTINNYLLPSGLIVAVLQLPLLDHFGLWSHFLFYFHPLRPGLWLMQAAFEPVPAGKIMYALAAAFLWLVGALWLARCVFWQQ